MGLGRSFEHHLIYSFHHYIGFNWFCSLVTRAPLCYMAEAVGGEPQTVLVISQTMSRTPYPLCYATYGLYFIASTFASNICFT